jgi:anti-sigma28 factor (negative regulator of flagellin synthesis)
LAANLLTPTIKIAKNVEKVNEIKAAIEDGRFEFDTAAIAEKLIATAHDLLNTQNLKR